MKISLLNFVAFVAVAFAAASCGSDGPRMEGQVPQQNPAAAQNQAAPPPAAPVNPNDVTKPNPRFSILRPFFFNYLKRPIDGKVDVFRSNLASFAPTIEIEAEEEVTQEGPTTPLQFYDVESYKLVLIMSGTATPKALLTDPQEKSYVVQVGTPIGNRNGKVVSISGAEVRIDEPGYPPVVKSLQSGSDDMIRELQSVQEY